MKLRKLHWPLSFAVEWGRKAGCGEYSYGLALIPFGWGFNFKSNPHEMVMNFGPLAFFCHRPLA